jgi:hypothetical protein
LLRNVVRAQVILGFGCFTQSLQASLVTVTGLGDDVNPFQFIIHHPSYILTTYSPYTDKVPLRTRNRIILKRIFSFKYLGFWTSSIVRDSSEVEDTNFWALDLFSCSDEGRETPTLLGSLERVDFNRCVK